MVPSYHAKASSNQNQRVPFFVFPHSLVWAMEFSIISSCLGKGKVYPIIQPCQS